MSLLLKQSLQRTVRSPFLPFLGPQRRMPFAFTYHIPEFYPIGVFTRSKTDRKSTSSTTPKKKKTVSPPPKKKRTSLSTEERSWSHEPIRQPIDYDLHPAAEGFRPGSVGGANYRPFDTAITNDHLQRLKRQAGVTPQPFDPAAAPRRASTTTQAPAEVEDDSEAELRAELRARDAKQGQKWVQASKQRLSDAPAPPRPARKPATAAAINAIQDPDHEMSGDEEELEVQNEPFGDLWREQQKNDGEASEEASGEDGNEIVPTEVKKNQPVFRVSEVDIYGRTYGRGTRKSCIAGVWIKPGSGNFFINRVPVAVYFPRLVHRYNFIEPFEVTGTLGKFDVWAIANGGGPTGQSGAVRLGICRALQRFDPKYRLELKRALMLRVDTRIVERKKPGQPKARRKFQWVRR
jgi:ribosomal protein S9